MRARFPDIPDSHELQPWWSKPIARWTKVDTVGKTYVWTTNTIAAVLEAWINRNRRLACSKTEWFDVNWRLRPAFAHSVGASDKSSTRRSFHTTLCPRPAVTLHLRYRFVSSNNLFAAYHPSFRVGMQQNICRCWEWVKKSLELS